ncbi:hypothetical protein LMG933_20750, partial [Xanthomonas euvesicatoria]
MACTLHPSQANASTDARTARYAILCIAFQRTRSRMAVDAFALILAMLGLGLLFARLRVLPDNSADVLNRIVLYICLPASVLTYVPRLHLDASL